MYKISVPVMNSNVNKNNRNDVLRELLRFNAERVFLAVECYEYTEEKQKDIFDRLKDNCEFFKENGLEVGMWTWVFGIDSTVGFGNLRTLGGEEMVTRACPSDEKFVSFCRDFMKKTAECGVNIIMFDDDFTCDTVFGKTPGCLCDRHIAAINSLTGENNDRETLASLILSGGKNKYRDAYLKANGDSLRAFSKAIRDAVDEVDPKIRIGACTTKSSWDIDGTDPTELSRILAGKNKPFYRLFGAPYWAARNAFGCSLQDVVELERMESSWTREEDVEIFAEGDVYPRPRYYCPASYLEGFDTAIRAAGCTDGILKYGIDYISNIDYEKGYAKAHERNRKLYEGIDEIFSGKKHVGIRVYETMKKVHEMQMQTAVNNRGDFRDMFFSKAAKLLAHTSIPTTYEGSGVLGICFDENARALPKSALDKGLIIDAQAAEILIEQGIDVGIKRIGKACSGVIEKELETDNKICHTVTPVTVFDNEFCSGIKVLSTLETDEGEIPLCYQYENANKNKFLVLNLNSRLKVDNKYNNTKFGPENVFRNYLRSKQIAGFVEYCTNKKLPAYVYGYPELYIQCKASNDGKLAVGLWNYFADEIVDLTVDLDESYSKVRFLNCSGELMGDKVRISTVAAFGYVFFELEK